MGIASDDWRRAGNDHLRGLTWVWAAWKAPKPEWDHDHCELCTEKLSDQGEALREGYRTPDSYRWICAPCFSDFREEFDFQLVR